MTTIACTDDGSGGAAAVLEVAGKDVAAMARIQVVAQRVSPTKHGGNSYGHERPTVAIDKGRIFVDCYNYSGSPMKVYDSVTFIEE